MSHSLVQSLQLTILGMGMTFMTIGALVAGMFLLTRLTTVRVGGRSGGHAGPAVPPAEAARTEGEALLTTRAEIQVTPQEGAPLSDAGEDAEARRRAAAAAVAVALALQEQAAPAPEAAAARAAPDAWNIYARSLHLSGRARYESLRGRR